MNNPLTEVFQGDFGEIPYKVIKKEHFMPAIEAGLKEAYKNLENIKKSNCKPDFKNSIEALETASDLLDRASSVYFNLYSLHSDSDLKELSDEISPILAKFSGDIYTDSKLFKRVKEVYTNRNSLNLNEEELRLTEISYKSFVRNGALLNDADKAELKKIDEELSLLSPRFSKNCLDAVNAYELHITDESKLSGIPENAKNAAKFTAESKGYKDGWLFTLQMPSYIPVIQYADDRELRRELTVAYGIKNLEGDFDNRESILETLKLRKKRAELLGYKNHPEYILEKRMAENSENVLNFLEDIYKIANPAASKEVQEVKDFAKKTDGISDFQAWDFQYYSQKLKKEKFDFDPEELRPYLKSENVIDGVFEVANRMYGLKFNLKPNIEVYHEDVRVFEVKDSSDRYIGLLYVDLYPRDTKQGGAWMNTFQTQGLQYGEVKRPHIVISGNMTPSTPDTPALLSFDEVRTIFHEFGHALHGLLSDVTYTSLASPNVYWDFVELPSQIMENWILEEQTLNIFAKHYVSGEALPTKYIDKIKAAQNFNAGYMNNRQLSFGLLDMSWHLADPETITDVQKFEEEVMERTRLLPKTGGNMSTGFTHIFAGGYASGYYSYKWAEVLDADAFEFFKEKGIFNRDVSESFRDNILSKGNTVDPMELYVKFRGSEPDPKALLRRDGLI